MKEVIVTYEHDPAQTGIKVVVSASEKDEQISELIDLIQDPCQRMWEVRTEEGGAITIPEEDIITISADSKSSKWYLRAAPTR